MRLPLLVTALALSLGAGSAWANSARSTVDFVQSIGVNTHLEAKASSYGNLGKVIDNLSYLGVVNIRDVAPRSAAGLAIYQDLLARADQLRLDLIVMGDPIREMPAITALAPHVVSVEGPNEVDRTPVHFQGQTGPAAVVANQKLIYAAVHGDSLLNGSALGRPRRTPVLNFSLARPDYGPYGDLSVSADLANVHAYASKGAPPYWMLPPNVKKAISTLDRPVVITETNYPTIIQPDGNGVTEAVQAKWLLNTLLDSFRNGVTRTYIYQLQDGVPDPTGRDFEAHFGVFRFDGTPKPAATALHNLVTLLRDEEKRPELADALSYQVGLPHNGFDLLLARPGGTFVLALWAEPAIWNAAGNEEVPAPSLSTAVTFLGGRHDVRIYDPLTGSTPIAYYPNIDRLVVTLTDHPVLLAIR